MLKSQIFEYREVASTAWWALYTRHQHEKTVAEMLWAKGFEVFLPVYEAMHRWKDRNKKISLPLFPGYVFVREDRVRRLQVLTTPGIYAILSHGGHDALIGDEEVQAIQRIGAAPSLLEPHPFLQCGELVRVIRGCLEGVEGILVRKKNMCRLVLSVDTLAQSVSVEIDSSDVVPARTPVQEDAWMAKHYVGGTPYHSTPSHV